MQLNNLIKRLVLVFALIIIPVSMSTLSVGATGVDVFQVCENYKKDPNKDQDKLPDVCKNKGDGGSNDQGKNPILGPNGILTKVISILSIGAGIVAVIIIIVSGLRIATSNGDSNTIASARQSIIYSLVGLVVVVVAQIIVLFVLSKIK